MDNMTMAALAAAAYLLLKPRAATAAIAPSPTPSPAPRPPLPSSPKPKPSQAPSVLPAPTAIPWPAASPPPVPVVPAQQPISFTTPAVITTAHAVPQNEEAALIARERNPDDKSYWMPVSRVTAQETAVAKELLGMWKPGAISFNGPRTFAGRRMFRASKTTPKSVTVWQPKPPFVHNAPASQSAPRPSGPPTLRQGASGSAVKDLQTRLRIPADGKFGPGTKAAVVAFQKSRGLTADGIVGPATWNALTANPPAAPPVRTATTLVNPKMVKPTIRQGASGPFVVELQKKLNVSADGKFGPGTKAAVVAFQKSRGLTADGIVGPATWNALGG